MRIAYFDCFSGISGDMALGALIACGISVDDLRSDLNHLGIRGWKLDARPTSQNGIGAVDVTVQSGDESAHGRHLSDIESILNSSDLPDVVCKRALAVFTRLAEAEARVHQTTPERIHFHEVGAIDAIVDIVGTCLALERLKVDRIECSALPMGRGFAECMHGTIPLPAPAVLELAKNVPTYGVDIEGELVTPTGAALVSTLASQFGPMPAMKIVSTGYGSGKKRFGNRPNLLRVVIGEAEAPGGGAEVVVIETNVDDLSPQFYERISERLFESGALDVYLTPVQMKKCRPATLLTVLCDPDSEESLAEIVFQETTTLGIRIQVARRLCMERKWVPVETQYGAVRMKVGEWRGKETTAMPEYEDVLRLARESGAPIRKIHQAAISAYAQTWEK